jgi:PAS domain S-box-containing protein
VDGEGGPGLTGSAAADQRRGAYSPSVEGTEYSSVLSSILDASTEYSIVATQLDGTFLLWNEGAHRIYGYEASETMGRNIRMLHRPEDLASGKIDEIFQTALQRGQWEGVVFRVRKGGETFACRIVLNVRRDSRGAPIGYLSISKDISEEGLLEQRLRDSEAYNRGLVEAAIDGLLITDLDGRITDVNREMENLSGSPREDLVGRRLHEVIAPRSAAANAIRQVLSEGRVNNLELRLQQPSGLLLDISCNATILRDGKKRPTGIIAAVHDIAESKRLREQLELRNRELEVQNERVRQADRMKTEFLARMSHELRTPLNSIIGFSDFLLTGSSEHITPDQREYLTDILNSGNHLLSLINDVLDLAKIESGKVELRPASFSLPTAVEEVCSSLRPQLQSHELDLHVDVDPDVDQVLLDAVRFKQILYNLLSNAVKFTPRKGRISVRVSAADSKRFLLQVQDTGIGIKPEDIGRIFREFEQVDNSTTRRYSGTGLGLPVTQKLVELMGGTISVQSEVGVGSTFSVRLPLLKTGGVPGELSTAGARA